MGSLFIECMGALVVNLWVALESGGRGFEVVEGEQSCGSRAMLMVVRCGVLSPVRRWRVRG